MAYLDHVLKNDKYQYAQLIIIGKIEGKKEHEGTNYT